MISNFHQGGPFMKGALLLIALGFGFKIFAEASVNPKKSIKQLGRLIGTTIMVISGLGIACSLWLMAQYAKMGYCPLGGYGKGSHSGKKWLCPFTAKTQPPDQNMPSVEKKS